MALPALSFTTYPNTVIFFPARAFEYTWHWLTAWLTALLLFTFFSLPYFLYICDWYLCNSFLYLSSILSFHCVYLCCFASIITLWFPAFFLTVILSIPSLSTHFFPSISSSDAVMHSLCFVS
ncbi:hypothetical protein BDQ12DRAFT_4727 [Crucibulum laeve]|uniref:Uncharacterized protein n=1 Tax=Crucibulum laeve TaxID=68775 RepID=A0A5C3MHL3_9AGAR|nr:hypothetical protein BDQ12DRAFT_4727 [Crucibulum laeve]